MKNLWTQSFIDTRSKFIEDVKNFFKENLTPGWQERPIEEGFSAKYPDRIEFSINWESLFAFKKEGVFFNLDLKEPSKGVGTSFPLEKMDEKFFEYLNRLIVISQETIEKKQRVPRDDDAGSKILTIRNEALKEFAPLLDEFISFIKKNR